MSSILNGIVCANITPFDKNGNVDYESLKSLARYLADSGLNAVYPLGTNGEGLALTTEERKKIAEIIIDEIGGKIAVAIQCGTQTLDNTKELVIHAKNSGADAAGIVTPFFFQQTQRALETYYSELFKAAEDFPVYIYNIPSHTNNDIIAETVKKLADRYTNLVGIKYSHPDLIRLSQYIHIKSEGFNTLIGCDRLIYAASSIGAVGTVSGPAAVFPELFSALWSAIKTSDYDKALKLQNNIFENDQALAGYQSIPLLKTYLKSIGVIADDTCRIPFDTVSEEIKKEFLAKIKTIKENVKL